MRPKFRDVAQVMVTENLVSDDDYDAHENNGDYIIDIFGFILPTSYIPKYISVWGIFVSKI